MNKATRIFVSLLAAGIASLYCYAVFAQGQGNLATSRAAATGRTSPVKSPLFDNLSSATMERHRSSATMERDRATAADPRPESAGDVSGRLAEPDRTRPAEPELSALEKAVFAGEMEAQRSLSSPYQAKELLQFGYNFFRPSVAGSTPLADVPVGADYAIAPGDRLIMNVWGTIDGSYELDVAANGEVVIPKVGAVAVAGVPFGKVREVLREGLSRRFKGFDLNVTMGKLSLIKVFVVGEVHAPGDYNIHSLSTLINALSAAGGPLKTGSLRHITIRRGGRLVETVDLYDFFLKGDKSRDIRLRSGDTIFVPVIGRVAGIAGNVKRPAIYELRNEKNLADLLSLAEGFLPTGYLQRIQVSRIDAHEKRLVSDFNIDPKGADGALERSMEKIAIRDMDIVRIFSIDARLRNHVRLEGHVLRPGDYAFNPGMRISGLVKKEDLLPEYYGAAAQVTRLYPPDDRPGIFFVDLARALAGDPAHDTELRESDIVKVFARKEMQETARVAVSGEVQQPGEFRLFSGMTVRDLVMVAGNLKESAFTGNAEVSRLKKSGDSVTSYSITVNLEEAMKGNPSDNIPLAPSDQLTVRRIPNWTDETDRFVTLGGEFVFPGVYPIYKGERLSSVIARAGGFSPKAFLRGARFTRESLREIQQQRMDEEIARAEREILKKQSELSSTASSQEELEASRSSLEMLKHQLDALKARRAEGRMILRLSPLERFRNSRFDVELTGGDKLLVPADPDAVSIIGQVYNPSSVVFADDEDVGYYLDQVGGPTVEADEGGMYVVKADGTVVSKKQASGIFSSGFLSRDVDSGDTIVVPQRYEKTAWMRNIKDIATILGQIALTAGVIIAAGL